jgi:hypothetical protein
MSAPSLPEGLTRSSQAALRWAASMARLREGLAVDPTVSSTADEFDLLVGTMLSHPERSEARQLLDHIGASALDILPPGYPPPAKVLEQLSTDVALEAVALTPEAEKAVELAAYEFRSADGLIELKALFGGLLSGSNKVASSFRGLLEDAGIGEAISRYGEYAKGQRSGDSSAAGDSSASGDYTAFLEEHHPVRREPVEIPEYKADKTERGRDLVDIRAEVDAFAYLLASRSLKPPLAVGLFGDWGSGKSYFMAAVRDRIARLVASEEALRTPQEGLPFWKRIVQIEFNAWHYVDGDLWASLVEHVFSELRVTGDGSATELQRMQRHWLEKMEAKRRDRAGITDEIEGKKREQGQAQRELDAALKRQEAEERSLEHARQDAVDEIVLEHSIEEAKEALSGFADSATNGTASQTLSAISDARTQLQRASVTLGAYPWTWRTSVAVGAALVAVPVLVFVLDRISALPAMAQLFAGASALLAVVAAGLRTVSAWAKGRLDTLEKAEVAVQAEIDEERRKRDDAVRGASKKVDDARAKIDELSGKGRVLDAELADLEARARTLTSSQILGDFVAERVGSSDYRARLGTAALIQRDFESLSRLIDEQNEEFLRTDTGETKAGPETLNRIILYIDDLDRCEPERVIKVLQAVHLLLAFPLFVVVVAVDSRWLAHSLAGHYPALASALTSDIPPDARVDGFGHATPADYLEKIFQVPFQIEPLGEAARRSLVRGLLEGNLATGATPGSTDGGSTSLVFADPEAAMVRDMFDRERVVRLETASLRVTRDELSYIDDLAPLLGDTPRSVKRFVNVYQLLCALPVPAGLDGTTYERLSGFILGLTDGMPSLYTALFRDPPKATSTGTLADLVATARPTVPDMEMVRYDAWAKAHADLVATPAAQLVEPARRVARFSFG